MLRWYLLVQIFKKKYTVCNLHKIDKMKLSYTINSICILLILWTIWYVFFIFGYKHLNFRFKFNTHIPASILYTRDLSHILNFSSIFVSFFKGHTQEPKICVRVASHYLSQKKCIIFLIIIIQFLSQAQILPKKCLI
jgi:hypothetical protein